MHLRLQSSPRHYNVHRWYQNGIGRYTRPDPLNKPNGNFFPLTANSKTVDFAERVSLQSRLGQPSTSKLRRVTQKATITNKMRTANPVLSADDHYYYTYNRPTGYTDPLGLSPVRNCGCTPVTASGNPGAGRGSGQQVEFVLPPDCKRYGGTGNPVPGTGDPGVTDIDFIEDTKIPGIENFPIYYLYDDCQGSFFISLFPPGGNPRRDGQPKMGCCCDQQAP